MADMGPAERGRLSARPGAGADERARRDAWLLDVPAAAQAGRACPLVVLFHGAGASARAGLALFPSDLDVIRLAPQSSGATWDVIEGGFGPDVQRLDDALSTVFASYPIDEHRVALAGFSDGASYALSLGIGNGDLVTHIIAFSLGFLAPQQQRGRPRIFATHGTHDRVLPIDRCSRRVIPRLLSAGYDITYEEFDGGHVVTPEQSRRAAEWLMRVQRQRPGRR
jgi:phospholipase/carboxylesterase